MFLSRAGADDLSATALLVAGQNPVDRVRFAATAPNALWVTASQDKTLFAHLGLNFLQVESLKDLLALKNALDSPDVFPFPVETIVFSGFERLQQTILDERMDGKHPSFEDWSWLKSQCHGILSAFRQTGLNIVVLTGVVLPHNGPPMLLPGIIGGFVNEISDYLDAMWLIQSDSSETNVEVSLRDVNVSEGEVIIDSDATLTGASTWLSTHPTEFAQWVYDGCNAMPPYYRLNFESDFEDIAKVRVNDVGESVRYDVEEVSVKEPDVTEETGQVTCDECGDVAEPNWVLLSELKGFPPLCKTHYSSRVG